MDHAADSFNILFSTVQGWNYQIDYKINLADSNWTLLNHFVALSNNFLLQDLQSSTNTSRFYRIQAVP